MLPFTTTNRTRLVWHSHERLHQKRKWKAKAMIVPTQFHWQPINVVDSRDVCPTFYDHWRPHAEPNNNVHFVCGIASYRAHYSTRLIHSMCVLILLFFLSLNDCPRVFLLLLVVNWVVSHSVVHCISCSCCLPSHCCWPFLICFFFTSTSFSFYFTICLRYKFPLVSFYYPTFHSCPQPNNTKR